jgi:hypothetical protein
MIAMTRTSELPLGAASDTAEGDPQVVIAALQQTIVELNQKIAELAVPPGRWLPLKAAAYEAGVPYENARQWAVRGWIEARREGKRWSANVISLKARKGRLAGRLSGDKATN